MPGQDARRGHGKKGRSGPIPSELRARMRGSLAERIPVAEEIADRATANDGDRLRALEFLAKHGMSEDDDGNPTATTERVVRVVREFVTRTTVDAD